MARVDLVQAMWLPEGRGSLAATRLRRLVEDVHAFLSKMKPGDGVRTLSDGRLYVGEITGVVERVRITP